MDARLSARAGSEELDADINITLGTSVGDMHTIPSMFEHYWPAIAVLSHVFFIVYGVLIYVTTLPDAHYWRPQVWGDMWLIGGGIVVGVNLLHWIVYMLTTEKPSYDYNYSIHYHALVVALAWLAPAGRFLSFYSKYGRDLSPFASFAPYPMVVYNDWMLTANFALIGTVVIFMAFVRFGYSTFRPESEEKIRLSPSQYKMGLKSIVDKARVNGCDEHVAALSSNAQTGGSGLFARVGSGGAY